MKIVVVGINHKNTPLNIREKGSFMTRTLKEGIEALKQEESIAEVLILSTCNRSEIYAATRNPEAALAALKDYYLKAKSPELEDYLFSYRER